MRVRLSTEWEINVSEAARFAQLFRGFTQRFGRYDLAGRKSEKGKEEGRAQTVDQEITDKDYADHVAGKVGIGIIPLKTDNTVNFAAIDIDVYKQEDQAKRNLQHSDIALALFETPLIVTRSKSGGIHVWLFSTEGVSARLATDYLQSQAALLGVAGTEVFPKQTERQSDEDVGNWINLPYFGDTRKAVIPKKVGTVYEFVDATLDQFLMIAERAAASVTDEWLLENTKLPPSQRNGGEVKADQLWFDGPPCLQSLIVGHPERVAQIERKFKQGLITEDQYKKQLDFTKPQLMEGARDNTFLNVGHYLRRRMLVQDTDGSLDRDQIKQLERDLADAHSRWSATTRNKGIAEAIPRLANQAGKGKWGYACRSEPLKSFCNRRLCLQRKFGIGTTQNDETAITGFTIVESEDRQYYMNVYDVRIHIPDAETLNSQALFAKQVLNQTDRMWRPMQEPKYREMIDALLLKADRIQPPPDSDRVSMLLNALDEFVHSRKIDKGKNDSGIHSGRVLLTEDGFEALFKFDHFMTYLRSRGYSWSPQIVGKMLVDDFKVQARPNTTIANKQIRPYAVNLVALAKLIEEGVSKRGAD